MAEEKTGSGNPNLGKSEWSKSKKLVVPEQDGQTYIAKHAIENAHLGQELIDEIDKNTKKSRHQAIAKLTREDVHTVLHGLVMHLPTKKIKILVNSRRAELGLEPLDPDDIEVWYYRRRYKNTLDKIYSGYVADIYSLAPLADKVQRLIHLDYFANIFEGELIRGKDEVDDNYRNNLRLYMSLLKAIYQEMGVVKFFKHAHADAPKSKDKFEPQSDDDLEKMMRKRFGSRVGAKALEDMEEDEKITDAEMVTEPDED